MHLFFTQFEQVNLSLQTDMTLTINIGIMTGFFNQLYNILFCICYHLKHFISFLSKFFELLAKCENVKSINISLNKYLTMKELMTLVHNCKRLEELKLARSHDNNINITDENIAYLISKLKNTVTVLKLDAINIASLTFDVSYPETY